MPYESVDKIQQLIDAGLGDIGRLEYILSTLKNGKKLYNSDQNYLDSLLKKHEEKIEPSESKKEIEDKSPVKFNENPSEYKPKKQPKPQKPGPLYGITYHTSDGSIKIHHSSCWHVQRTSQTGSTKWYFVHGYQEAKSQAETIARREGSYCKNAQCCLDGIISKSLGAAVFLALFPFLGLLSNLIVREYYPTFAKGLKYFGLIYGVAATIFYFSNWIRYHV